MGRGHRGGHVARLRSVPVTHSFTSESRTLTTEISLLRGWHHAHFPRILTRTARTWLRCRPEEDEAGSFTQSPTFGDFSDSLFMIVSVFDLHRESVFELRSLWNSSIAPGKLETMARSLTANCSSTFAVDPEFRDLLPRLTKDERELLKRQIRREGRLLSPLVVWAEANLLIDGHHRSELVDELRSEGVEIEQPPIAYKSFRHRLAVIRWMVNNQNARRNWTVAERAAAVLRNRELIDRLRREAKERQRGGKRLSPASPSGDTRKMLARLAGVGEGTISRVQRVLDSGNQRVIRLLLEKKRISAREARHRVIRDEQKQKLRLQSIHAATFQRPSVTELQRGVRLICADVLNGLKQVEPGSVSLAVTSPPYPITVIEYDNYRYDGDYDKYIAWLDEVYAAVAVTLRHGGRFVINVDSVAEEFGVTPGDVVRPIYADTVNAMKRAGLSFMGEVCWYKQFVVGRRVRWGTYASCRSPRLRRNHEYLLVFYKGSRELEGDPQKCDLSPEEFRSWCVGHWHILPEKRNRSIHPAPMPEALVERAVKMFCYVDDLVLDPFCGSGTVPLVSARLGRRCVGIDNAPRYIEQTRNRLSEYFATAKP